MVEMVLYVAVGELRRNVDKVTAARLVVSCPSFVNSSAIGTLMVIVRWNV